MREKLENEQDQKVNPQEEQDLLYAKRRHLERVRDRYRRYMNKGPADDTVVNGAVTLNRLLNTSNGANH